MLTFRHLDATISFGEGAELKSLHKRVDEVSQKGCEMLGVSRSVIDYVLFCHQEESDWPLDTDVVVKDRFDRIFEATRHNKMLDKMIKIRKQSASSLPMLRESLSQSLDDRLVAHKRSLYSRTTNQLCQGTEERVRRQMSPVESQTKNNIRRGREVGEVRRRHQGAQRTDRSHRKSQKRIRQFGHRKSYSENDVSRKHGRWPVIDRRSKQMLIFPCLQDLRKAIPFDESGREHRPPIRRERRRFKA